MLKPHASAPLEYWFFKVNFGEKALLVDWICRRKLEQGSLRISIHSPSGREVLSVPHPAILRHGAPELAMRETSWPRGDVRWHLTIDALPDRIRPQIFPAEQLRLFDMSLQSAPTVIFNGWVEHHGERYAVEAARGMLAHYWGRRLPRDWWWISANQFADADIAVECMLLHSRVWGTAMQVPLGYLYLRNSAHRRLLVSPPSRLTVSGAPETFQVTARPLLGKPIVLKAIGRDYASLGEGIINTLMGDLTVWEGDRRVAQATGTAGLERRPAADEASIHSQP